MREDAKREPHLFPLISSRLASCRPGIAAGCGTLRQGSRARIGHSARSAAALCAAASTDTSHFNIALIRTQSSFGRSLHNGRPLSPLFTRAPFPTTETLRPKVTRRNFQINKTPASQPKRSHCLWSHETQASRLAASRKDAACFR